MNFSNLIGKTIQDIVMVSGTEKGCGDIDIRLTDGTFIHVFAEVCQECGNDNVGLQIWDGEKWYSWKEYEELSMKHARERVEATK